MKTIDRQINTIVPAVNVRDEGKEVILEAEMPGLSKEDIKIEVIGDELILDGAKKECEEPKGYNLIYSERCAYRYSRKFVLGEDINKEKIDAKYENGLLTVKFDRNEDTQPRKIEVQ